MIEKFYPYSIIASGLLEDFTMIVINFLKIFGTFSLKNNMQEHRPRGRGRMYTTLVPIQSGFERWIFYGCHYFHFIFKYIFS